MSTVHSWPEGIAGGRRLLVAASTGGHLDEMVRLSDSLAMNVDSVWVTFDTPQSRSLLAGKNVVYIDYVSPRDVRAALAGARAMRAHLKRDADFDAAISTGSGIALSVLPVTRLHGIDSLYVESACRFDGPSMTGKILSRVPGVSCLSPGQIWSKQWGPGPSVFGRFEVQAAKSSQSPRILVSLGTIRPYRFDALVDSVGATGLADDNTVWQLGATDRADLDGMAVAELSTVDFDQAIDECDVVITHAGIGNVLRILDKGKVPVVVPRRRARGEHVDDHQLELCKTLTQSGIGVVCEPEDLTAETILSAGARKVVRVA
ncbi:glycosyltransferase [Rhodococcus hoagii]|nr:glycosyltransferase [Prescottella equi]